MPSHLTIELERCTEASESAWHSRLAIEKYDEYESKLRAALKERLTGPAGEHRWELLVNPGPTGRGVVESEFCKKLWYSGGEKKTGENSTLSQEKKKWDGTYER